MLTVPAPAPGALDGDRLRDELAEAGIAVTVEAMMVNDGRIVFPGLSDTDRQTVEGAVDRHMSRPAPVNPDDELDAALADAAAKPTVEEKVDAMLAALRGQAGHDGRVAGRPA